MVFYVGYQLFRSRTEHYAFFGEIFIIHFRQIEFNSKVFKKLNLCLKMVVSLDFARRLFGQFLKAILEGFQWLKKRIRDEWITS